MIRSYVNWEQDDWDIHLTAIEISINNTKQASTKMSPFFFNYGQHPMFPLNQMKHQSSKSVNPTAAQAIDSLADRITEATKHLLAAQQYQKAYADQKRKDLQFEVGEQVMLSTKNIRIKDRTRKLAQQFIGPYKVTQKILSLVYKLELPDTMRIHPVFHVSKLKKYKDGMELFPSRIEMATSTPEIE